MSGRSIELSEGGDQVLIRFPFHPALLTVVRGLPQRRFDQLRKCWSCPVDAIVEVVDILLPHDFGVAAPAREVYVARGGSQELAAGPAIESAPAPPKCAAIHPPPAASDVRPPAAADSPTSPE